MMSVYPVAIDSLSDPQGSTPFLLTLNPDNDNRRLFWFKSELKEFLQMIDPRTPSQAGFDVMMEAVAKFGHWGFNVCPTAEKALEFGLTSRG